jgi:hypothetical protein
MPALPELLARRVWTALRVRDAAMTALFLLLAVGLLVSPARAAATPGLSGVWLNSSYTLSTYQLHTSADGKTLTANWGTDIGKLQGGVVGAFTGTLNQSGTAFTGQMHVSEGSLRIGGTMTVTITTEQRFGYPVLTVSYQQDNGVAATLTLEIWLLPPKLASRAVTFAFACPGPRSCQDGAEAQALGVAGGGTVASVHFTVKPGATSMIRLALDKAGQKLLAARRSLRARVVVVALKKSSTLPPLTTLATVRFQIR